MTTALTNLKLFDGTRIIHGHAVILSGSIIEDIVPAHKISATAIRHDLGGALLAPGFVDIQVNGGGGVLFNSDPTVAALATIAAAHRTFGTTSLLPTLISDHFDIMTKAADAVADALLQNIPGIRGIHFEGPYLNPARRGVHAADMLQQASKKSLELLTRSDLGAVVTTLAPECNSTDFIRTLVRANVRVCAGHSAATYDQVQIGLQAGITGFTHLFNAMSPLTSREPGIVGAALDSEDSWCGIIADGHHIHDTSLRIAIRAKATSKTAGKMMLVTDAMPSVGAADKSFVLNGETITATQGKCVTRDGTLAGSDLDMASAVRHTVNRLNLPVEEALRMASLYPATFLGLDQKIGHIKAGYDADLVLLDANLHVLGTWIAGSPSQITKG